MTDHERQGTAYDRDAVGHEKVGRDGPPAYSAIGDRLADRATTWTTFDILDVIGRAMWEQRRRFTAQEAPHLPPLEEWEDGSVPRACGVHGEAEAILKAIGEAGYRLRLIAPIAKGTGGRPKTVDEDEIRRLRSEGLAVPQIVKLTGVSRAAVYRALA